MAVRQAQLWGLALREALGRRRVLRLEALFDFSDEGYGDPDSQIGRIHAYPHSDSDLQLERAFGYYSEVGYYSGGTLDIDSNGILSVSAEGTGTVESDKGTITDDKGHLAEETLDIDSNGILNLSAEDAGTAERQKGTITNDKGHLTEAYRENMIKEAVQFGDDDKSVKESVGGKSAFEQAGLKITMNVDNLEDAYTYEQLPSDDLGMTRLGAVARDAIGVHPKAVLNYGSLDAAAKALVERKVLGYASPREFYVHKIVGEVAAIAVSVYPKRLIVQVSDYGSNVGNNLIGGDLLEPDEENSMIGFRGSGRYIDPFFEECFAMEPEAVRNIRGEMGPTNIEVMIPFVRMVDMVKNISTVLERSGLRNGEDDLKVNMMVGLLNNFSLAEGFLENVDGFYIDSNDLMRLTLGADCESGLVAQSVDERNPPVMEGLELLIKTAKTKGKYVGTCHRDPSNGFMDQNRLQETTYVLWEALKEKRPEQAQLQTQPLAMNLQQARCGNMQEVERVCRESTCSSEPSNRGESDDDTDEDMPNLVSVDGAAIATQLRAQGVDIDEELIEAFRGLDCVDNGFIGAIGEEDEEEEEEGEEEEEDEGEDGTDEFDEEEDDYSMGRFPAGVDDSLDEYALQTPIAAPDAEMCEEIGPGMTAIEEATGTIVESDGARFRIVGRLPVSCERSAW